LLNSNGLAMSRTKLEAASRRRGPAAGENFVQQRVRAFEHRRPYCARPPVVERLKSVEPPALSGVIKISGLVRRLWIGSRSISFLAAIIVGGVLAQPPAVAYMARTDAEPTAAGGG
jgi:hypothetical protein